VNIERKQHFRREMLKSGQWVHVRSRSPLGWLIRFTLDKWESRVCASLGVPAVRVWGNHDGLVITPDCPHAGPPFAVAESLAAGAVLTSLEEYEADLARGRLEVRIFEPVPELTGEAPAQVMHYAAENWKFRVMGDSYDAWSWPGLALCAFLGIRVNTEDRRAAYCTEGVAQSYLDRPPALDLLQDSQVAPHHVEQAAGLIPRSQGRRTTLREVTDAVLY
jgi:hypothetical protein